MSRCIVWRRPNQLNWMCGIALKHGFPDESFDDNAQCAHGHLRIMKYTGFGPHRAFDVVFAVAWQNKSIGRRCVPQHCAKWHDRNIANHISVCSSFLGLSINIISAQICLSDNIYMYIWRNVSAYAMICMSPNPDGRSAVVRAASHTHAHALTSCVRFDYTKTIIFALAHSSVSTSALVLVPNYDARPESMCTLWSSACACKNYAYAHTFEFVARERG